MEPSNDHPWDKVIGFCLATTFERSILRERNYLIDGMKWKDEVDERQYFRCGRDKTTGIDVNFVSFNNFWICFISFASIKIDLCDLEDFVLERKHKSKYSALDCQAIRFDWIVQRIIQEKNKS